MCKILFIILIIFNKGDLFFVFKVKFKEFKVNRNCYCLFYQVNYMYKYNIELIFDQYEYVINKLIID